MKKRLEATVRGRVQGVGFRFFVQRNAARLNLQGIARNEANGSVTVIMEGEDESLQNLLVALHQGPGLAKVDGVQYKMTNPTLEFDGIEVE